VQFQPSYRNATAHIHVHVPLGQSRKISREFQQIAKAPNAEDQLPKILAGSVGRTNVTDERQTTDGRAIAYSELIRSDIWPADLWQRSASVCARRGATLHGADDDGAKARRI